MKKILTLILTILVATTLVAALPPGITEEEAENEGVIIIGTPLQLFALTFFGSGTKDLQPFCSSFNRDILNQRDKKTGQIVSGNFCPFGFTCGKKTFSSEAACIPKTSLTRVITKIAPTLTESSLGKYCTSRNDGIKEEFLKSDGTKRTKIIEQCSVNQVCRQASGTPACVDTIKAEKCPVREETLDYCTSSRTMVQKWKAINSITGNCETITRTLIAQKGRVCLSGHFIKAENSKDADISQLDRDRNNRLSFLPGSTPTQAEIDFIALVLANTPSDEAQAEKTIIEVEQNPCGFLDEACNAILDDDIFDIPLGEGEQFELACDPNVENVCFDDNAECIRLSLLPQETQDLIIIDTEGFCVLPGEDGVIDFTGRKTSKTLSDWRESTKTQIEKGLCSETEQCSGDGECIFNEEVEKILDSKGFDNSLLSVLKGEGGAGFRFIGSVFGLSENPEGLCVKPSEGFCPKSLNLFKASDDECQSSIINLGGLIIIFFIIVGILRKGN